MSLVPPLPPQKNNDAGAAIGSVQYDTIMFFLLTCVFDQRPLWSYPMEICGFNGHVQVYLLITLHSAHTLHQTLRMDATSENVLKLAFHSYQFQSHKYILLLFHVTLCKFHARNSTGTDIAYIFQVGRS